MLIFVMDIKIRIIFFFGNTVMIQANQSLPSSDSLIFNPLTVSAMNNHLQSKIKANRKMRLAIYNYAILSYQYVRVNMK